MSQLYGQNHLQEKSFSENVYKCLNIVSLVVNIITPVFINILVFSS